MTGHQRPARTPDPDHVGNSQAKPPVLAKDSRPGLGAALQNKLEKTTRALLKKTLMLGKIEGKRRRGQWRMRWLDGIITEVWSIVTFL